MRPPESSAPFVDFMDLGIGETFIWCFTVYQKVNSGEGTVFEAGRDQERVRFEGRDRVQPW